MRGPLFLRMEVRMTDVHCHVLPGLDDGARTVEDSLAMLEAAEKDGITAVVATPHSNLQYDFHPSMVNAALEKLCAAYTGPIEIHTGCEMHLMLTTLDQAVADPKRFSIAQKSYLLLELNDYALFSNTEDNLKALEGAGLRIIIAHPERNPLLQSRIEMVREWAAAGRLMQITAASIFGRFGKQAAKTSRELLDAGLVHIVASDAHDIRRRPHGMAAARTWIEENYSPDLARLLFVDHPNAIVRGDAIDLTGFPPKLVPDRRWKLF